uniref:Uncharacterized protein n=1 Tax=Tanacetum cinerariifolium TaxID=118510 RepID=A0A6L2M0W9_TANCI|nr:hypothetical protein [Tanacetum cinerariifolium]
MTSHHFVILFELKSKKDCPKYGNPVDGLYCRHCALLQKKLKEQKFSKDFLNTFESSNDDSNVVNIPQEPIVSSQDPDENSSQSPPQIDHHCCYGCGDSSDDIFCQRCTCKACGKGSHYGYNYSPKVPIIFNLEPCHDQNVEEFLQTLPSFHPTCYSGDENSFAYDLTPNLVNDSPNIFNSPSQPPMYSYEFCRDYAHYSYDYINISKLPPCIAITPILSTKEPKDSLIIGDEHLDTIPEKESDEFIKSSVENLVPNPSKSEDERECDVPACDDFTSFSNLLFDADDDFSSSDNESFFDEDISIKIDRHHFNAKSDLIESMLNQDSSIIFSSKIDSLLDEFADELILLKSVPSGNDEADCDPEEEIRLIKKLFNDSLSLPKNESFHFDIPSSPRPPTKPPDDDKLEPNSGILTPKVVGDTSEHYVPIPRLLPTQTTLASNQEKSPHLLSHMGLKPFQLSSESPMMIYGGNIPILDVSFLHFYPL